MMPRDVMRWSEVVSHHNNNNNNNNNDHNSNGNNNGGSSGGSNSAAPTIKNHSVTHFGGYLFCFGGYDGRRNHMTLLLYNIAENRWIRPHHIPHHHHHHPNQQQQQQQHLGNNNNNYQQQQGGSHDNGSLSLLQQQQHAAAAAALVGESNFSMADNSAASTASGGASVAADQHHHHTITVQGTPPPGRNGHSATLAIDHNDPSGENAKIVIIGGWLGTGPLAASDMYVLDVSAGGRQLQWYQPAVKGTPPGPCNMHSADYVTSRRAVYVFRGGNGREYLNDLHALQCDTLTWVKVETRGEVPQPRANHSSAMLEETQELCLFGGWNGGERLNDIHILNTITSTWTCPRVGGVLPHPRAGMTLTALRGRLMLFGGSGTSAKCFNDLQILDRQEMVWLDVSHVDTTTTSLHDGTNISSSKSVLMVNGNQEYDTDDCIPTFRFGNGGAAASDSYLGGGSHRTMTNRHYLSSHEDSTYSSFLTDETNVEDSKPASSTTQQQHLNQQQQQQYSLTPRGADWRARDELVLAAQIRHATNSVRNMHLASATIASPNPNDEDTVPTVLIYGKGPGRRAGHTATAVNRKIYIFGGSCGSEYLNDFYVLDTDPPPRAVVTEPNSLQLFERRLCHFFNDEEFSDVTFLVEGQKVYGHKMVLSIVSDCFRAMFTTGFRESQAMEISIPDCSHGAFLAVMEYIYTGSLPKALMSRYHHQQQQHAAASSASVAPTAVADELLVEMLELADRFFLDHLKQICETMLHIVVNADTVDYLLSVAQKTNADQLQMICEHYIRNRDDAAAGAANPSSFL